MGCVLLSVVLAASAQTAGDSATSSPTNRPALEEPEPGQTNEANDTQAAPFHPRRLGHHAHGGGAEQVIYGQDVEIKKGETAEQVVVIGGSVKVAGKVKEDVVVIGGGLTVEEGGEIGGDSVTIGGGINLRRRTSVGGDAVAVMGGVQVGTNAVVHGDAVGVGGGVDVAEGGTVRGDTTPINFGLKGFGLPRWFKLWLVHCVFKLRPLALQVGWVWVVAGLFFLLYLLVAAVLPRPVAVCVEELVKRPVTTLFLGLLTPILAAVLIVILLMTGLGVFVVPFLLAALFIGGLFGKVAIVEWLGLGLGRAFGGGALQKPLVGFLIGAALVTGLYLLWFLGLMAFCLLGIWGLGAAMAATFARLRRELPQRPAAAAAAATPGPGPMPASAGQGTAPSEPPGPIGAATFPSVPPTSAAPAGVPEVLYYPRASFWERMGAGFLDLMLLGILSGMAKSIHVFGGGGFFLLLAVAYFAGLWTWRGTSVGGIVLGLKVVSLDGQPLTFPVALVRSLGAAFSVSVCFLGFLWIAWDPEKQGWHDRIAGTVVLRMPKGTPLVSA